MSVCVFIQKLEISLKCSFAFVGVVSCLTRLAHGDVLGKQAAQHDLHFAHDVE